MGHLRLHSRVLRQLRFDSVETWIDAIRQVPSETYMRIEWQAYEFAGRLLVPIEDLRAAFAEGAHMARSEGYARLEREEVLDFIAGAICRDFGVSRDVIRRRIRNEGLLPDVPGTVREHPR